MKSKLTTLVLLGLITTLAACQPQAETPDEMTSPAVEETIAPAGTPAETSTPSETPTDEETPSIESPSPSPS